MKRLLGACALFSLLAGCASSGKKGPMTEKDYYEAAQRSLRFERIGVRRGYYPSHGGREDALVMWVGSSVFRGAYGAGAVSAYRGGGSHLWRGGEGGQARGGVHHIARHHGRGWRRRTHFGAALAHIDSNGDNNWQQKRATTATNRNRFRRYYFGRRLYRNQQPRD